MSFALRLLAVLVGGWLVAAVAPVLNLWLSLPAAPEEFILRPYSLLTYWLLSPSLENLAQTALGLIAYGSLLQPRLTVSVLVRLAAISIVVAGLLYVVLPNSGLLVGALPIGAGFAGAVLRLWVGQRRDFAWWEHLLTAYAALTTSILLVSAVAQPSNILAAGTVAAGALYAHIALGRTAAQQGAAADEPQRVPIDL